MIKKIAGITIALFMFCAPFVSAQLPGGFGNSGNGYIRIADIGQITDTVSVWGDVGQSGRYIIPEGISLPELISFSHGYSAIGGGRRDNRWTKKIIEIKVSHYDKDRNNVQSKLFSYKYEDPIPIGMFKYDLQNNDIVTLQVTRKPTFGDYVRIIAPVVGILATSILLIQNLR